jgi:hypothetical protein
LGVAYRTSGIDGSTPVVMADGSRKPIREVVRGDRVLATDPVTRRTEPRPVVDTIVGEGEKELVDITVSASAGVTATVTATGRHRSGWTTKAAGGRR